MVNKYYKMLLLYIICSFSYMTQGNPLHSCASSMKAVCTLALKTIIPTDIASVTFPAAHGVRKIYHPQGSEITAHHEAGHAVIAYSKDITTIKMIHIDGKMGWVELEGSISITDEEIKAIKDDEIKSFMIILLAGPATEYEFDFTQKTRFTSFDDCYKDLFYQIEFSSDLRGAHKLAMILALKYCEKNYKVFNQTMVKQEAERILKECYRKTLIQVHAQRSDIQAVAQVVLEKKSISGKKFYDIMRERKAL